MCSTEGIQKKDPTEELKTELDAQTMKTELDDCIWVISILKEIQSIKLEFKEDSLLKENRSIPVNTIDDVYLRVITYLYRLRKNSNLEVLRILILVRTWMNNCKEEAQRGISQNDSKWYRIYRSFFEDYYHGQFLNDSVTDSIELDRIPIGNGDIVSATLFANGYRYSENCYRNKLRNGNGEDYPIDNTEEVALIYPCISSSWEGYSNYSSNRYINGKRYGDYVFIGRAGPLLKCHYVNGLQNGKSYYYAVAPTCLDYTLSGDKLLVKETIPQNVKNENLINSLRNEDKKEKFYVVLKVSNYLNSKKDGRQLSLQANHSLNTISYYHNFKEEQEKTYTFVGMNVCYKGVHAIQFSDT